MASGGSWPSTGGSGPARADPRAPRPLFGLEANAHARSFYGHLGGAVAERRPAEQPEGIVHPVLRPVGPAVAALERACG